MLHVRIIFIQKTTFFQIYVIINVLYQRFSINFYTVHYNCFFLLVIPLKELLVNIRFLFVSVVNLAPSSRFRWVSPHVSPGFPHL
jgi:hypothetical protein